MRKNNAQNSGQKPVVKESPSRSIAKAISWRLIASGTTWLIVFVIFRRYSEQSFHEVIETASFITAIELVAKILFYYLHERLWINIDWGKNWQKSYWGRRAWRKLYRDRHK